MKGAPLWQHIVIWGGCIILGLIHPLLGLLAFFLYILDTK